MEPDYYPVYLFHGRWSTEQLKTVNKAFSAHWCPDKALSQQKCLFEGRGGQVSHISLALRAFLFFFPSLSPLFVNYTLCSAPSSISIITLLHAHNTRWSCLLLCSTWNYDAPHCLAERQIMCLRQLHMFKGLNWTQCRLELSVVSWDRERGMQINNPNFLLLQSYCGGTVVPKNLLQFTQCFLWYTRAFDMTI